MSKRVLITGMSGLIGGLVRQHLQGRYEISGLNRRDVFYAISKNKWGYRDMSRAKEVLGFEAQDAAEDYR